MVPTAVYLSTVRAAPAAAAAAALSAVEPTVHHILLLCVFDSDECGGPLISNNRCNTYVYRLL